LEKWTPEGVDLHVELNSWEESQRGIQFPRCIFSPVCAQKTGFLQKESDEKANFATTSHKSGPILPRKKIAKKRTTLHRSSARLAIIGSSEKGKKL
jgi:hypothetical protein